MQGFGGAERIGLARAQGGRRVTLMVDPRFPGGTATAVAAEIAALAGAVDLGLAPLETRMLAGAPLNPRLAAAAEAAGLDPGAAPRGTVRGDVVVLHNPACLKFDEALSVRISCDTLIAVAHENFLRPGGAEGFDVGACLDRIGRAALARRLLVAPISRANRRGVEDWFAVNRPERWAVAPFDWPNVCAMPHTEPSPAPRDRRGRHSRPGFEKFPPLSVMQAHFPGHAEHCAILGADAFLADPETLPRHWQARPFGSMEVGAFLAEIDVFVYFTHPLWAESFGMAVAEAVAAGKLVITDPGTAETFGPGVIGAEAGEVEAAIARHLADPALYRQRVETAQRGLAPYAPAAARERVLGILGGLLRAEQAEASDALL